MKNKVNIILTHNCNLRCLHCYLNAGGCKDDFNDIYKKTINMIDLLAKDGFKEIMFTGGECLLFPRIKELIKYAKEKNLYVSIFTNGMIYNEEIFNLIDSINISVDGPEEIHNRIRCNKESYKNIIKVLDYLKKKDVYTTIQMTINNLNYNKLDYLKELTLNHLNIRNVKFVFVDNTGRAKENNLYYDNNMVFYINNFLDKLYFDTKFHIQFSTNLINHYEFENYCLNDNSIYPIWFDIPDNKYYVFSENVLDCRELAKYNCKDVLKDLDMIDKELNKHKQEIMKKNNIDLEKDLSHFLRGN